MRSRSQAWVSARPPSRPRARIINSPPSIRPWRLGEFLGRSARHRDDRAFGDIAIALGNVERVGMAGDQLDPEREAALVDQSPAPRSSALVIGSPAMALCSEFRRWRAAPAAGRSCDCVDQPVEQVRPPRELSASAGAWARISAKMPGQLRPRLEQAVEIDRRSTAARRYRDSRLSACSGSAPAAIARRSRGSIASNAVARGGGAQRTRLARPPVADRCAAATSGSAKPSAFSSLRKDVRIVGKSSLAIRRQ